MSTLNDDELRSALARRASTSLTSDERNDVLRAARVQATEPRRRQPVLPRLAGLVAAIAAVLVLVIVALPIALSPPQFAAPSHTPVAVSSATRASSAPPSTVDSSEPPSPSVTPDGLAVYTAQELADMIGDPDWIGKAVLAHASITELDRACVPEPNICARAGELDGVSGLNEVTAGYRDSTSASHFSVDEGNGYRWLTPLEIPSGAGLFAFTIQKDAVEFLGPAYLSPAGNPVKVSDLVGVSSTLPSDGVIAISGWLMHTLEAPCAFPQEGLRTPMPDISSYYCGGSWLTDEPAAQPVSGLTIEDGAHVQNDAYDSFATDPQPADGGGTQPRQGIYLVRNAGCPEVVTGNCPVWRMVGRLHDTSGSGPTPTAIASPPAGIQIPTGTQPPNSSPQPCPAAVRTVFLVADDTYGVATQTADGPVGKVIWPFGYRAVADGDRVALLDESGLLLAHTGDYVSIGGGDMPDGWFNGCGGVTVVGPDGSSPPDASATPPGTAGKIEYFHLADALVSARSAISDPSAQLRSYAPGDYDSVVQILLGPWAASVPPPNGATGRTMVWGVSFLTGKLLATVYIDLFSGDVYGIETRNVPTNLADIHKSDIVFGDLTVQVANNTSLDVSIYVNGTLAAAAPANQGAIVDPYEFGPAPWTIRTTTRTGRRIDHGRARSKDGLGHYRRLSARVSEFQ